MGFLSVLSCAHKLVEERLRSGETAVDATVGNGVDTLFLAKLTGAAGRVYGFDIQEAALAKAQERLRESGLGTAESVSLVCSSHERMLDHIDASLHGQVGAVMFNLGYLPGGDHATITTAASTLPALTAALTLLRKGGIVTVVLYPGHEGGAEEAEAVQQWAVQLPQSEFQSLCYRFLNALNNPPYVIAVEKR
ncbi:class I SAM-dependent methyltransferase [Paenibacillus sp. MBLB4367]|uniref:class I SAM-dependent methyltransferase n=1 Tax=Paenibacillus sp. MBLB4367 TaxID=3384767 RepID=UPI00390821DC